MVPHLVFHNYVSVIVSSLYLHTGVFQSRVKAESCSSPQMTFSHLFLVTSISNNSQMMRLNEIWKASD